MLSALAWESETQDDAIERSVGFLMSPTTTKNLGSPQESPKSSNLCTLCDEHFVILVSNCQAPLWALCVWLWVSQEALNKYHAEQTTICVFHFRFTSFVHLHLPFLGVLYHIIVFSGFLGFFVDIVWVLVLKFEGDMWICFWDSQLCCNLSFTSSSPKCTYPYWVWIQGPRCHVSVIFGFRVMSLFVVTFEV
jgi:hypothetical protein